MNTKIDAEVDFTQLAKTFPLQDGVVMQGELKTKLNTAFKIEDLERKDIGKLALGGFVHAKNISLRVSAASFNISINNAGFASRLIVIVT